MSSPNWLKSKLRTQFLEVRNQWGGGVWEKESEDEFLFS